MSSAATGRQARRLVRWQVRLGLLVVMSALAGLAVRSALRQADAAYDEELTQLADPGYRDRALEAPTRSHRADTFARMAEQNALMFQWGVVLLGAVAALVTTNKVHRIGHVETVYVLLAPAAVLLLGSISAGIAFQRRLTYLVSKDQLHIPALNKSLFQQGELLFWSLVCLACFVIAFHLCIVFGETDPTEAGKEGS